MGWFDEQIKQRKRSDNQVFEDSFNQIANAVLGKDVENNNDKSYYTKNAMSQILLYYGYKNLELPDEVKDFNDQIEYLCRPYGLMRRTVKLTQGWYNETFGALLTTFVKDEKPVALIPGPIRGYFYYEDGKPVYIDKSNESLFSEQAISFYKPLPLRKITPLDLVKYAIFTRKPIDIINSLILMGISTGLGLFLPKVSYFLMKDIVEEKSINLLISTLIFSFSLQIGMTVLSTIKSILTEKMNLKMNVSLQAAAMMRVLSLPANFFRQYSSGDLSSRVGYISSLANTLMSAVFDTTIDSLFSLAYIYTIFDYAPILVIPSLVVIVTTILCSIISTLITTRRSLERMKISSKESGMSYAMISGIQKIKLSGAEKRAFARWGNLFAQETRLAYKIEYTGIISMIISSIGSIVMYYVAIKSNIDTPGYYAFQTSYGMVSSALSSLASIFFTFANIRPTLEMVKPLLDAEPEISEGKQAVTHIQGGIEMNNVSFKYEENMPLVINNMSLKIKPGQYVAIVGKTGCGKSTLIRLLLGFEKPEKGSIYYDGKDIQSIDLKSLRRKIGVVMQNGKLFSGDIFSNITISAPWLTLDDAWKAAEMSGIADDIRKMPMGMHTLISEGSGGISGGQRQRLLIARAIAPKPRVLIFDEATSALDNLTQKKIADSLDTLKCTRIVIAHRLSTIRHCDRILYLEDGKIVEDGTYEELIAKNGKFAELVERQRLDS